MAYDFRLLTAAFFVYQKGAAAGRGQAPEPPLVKPAPRRLIMTNIDDTIPAEERRLTFIEQAEQEMAGLRSAIIPDFAEMAISLSAITVLRSTISWLQRALLSP
jgi:hypothetical protein